eukprot:scaffold3119_cov53-Attheya_sp.AAC.4
MNHAHLDVRQFARDALKATKEKVGCHLATVHLASSSSHGVLKAPHKGPILRLPQPPVSIVGPIKYLDHGWLSRSSCGSLPQGNARHGVHFIIITLVGVGSAVVTVVASSVVIMHHDSNRHDSLPFSCHNLVNIAPNYKTIMR